jgi:hypothetical protein
MTGGIGVVTKSLLLICCGMVSASAALADMAAIARQQQSAVAAVLSKSHLSALTQTDAASPTSAAAEGYGHALLMRRSIHRALETPKERP